ncbi:hypothetical protein RHGRI_022431 [Rhododendron griersonianum]|uniref:non-specific serine/threonine protein kinase n=1 Tax=Rhododendron griersonianum TaxID=479676 RepID=A0AAV6J2Y8_9ERIC|nr:hypothetical protein RHGRI_022431 [Rhododendron griersonianum]
MTSKAVSVYFLILIYVCLNPLVIAVDENQFVYNGFNGANIHLDGGAKIHSNGLLQLTNNSIFQIGHAFYPRLVRFYTSSSMLTQDLSFSTHFVFAIVPQRANLSGDGMVFAISPSLNFTQARGGSYLGLLNSSFSNSSDNGLRSNHLLAIELDTFQNQEFNEIDGNHVGIDVNSVISNVSVTVTYYSNEERINRSLDLISGSPTHVWIEYDGFENVLNVTLAPISSPKPDQSLLSTHINLSSILSDSMYVGFSAATGIASGDHYILGWSFNKSGKAQGLEISKLPSLPRQRKPSRGITVLRITVSVTIVLVVGLTITIAGILYVLRRKKYEEIREDWEREYGPHRFSYKDLYKATRGFIDKELLGVGGFGKVYRGVLPSSKEQVAIKKVSQDSKQGMKEFVAEIASMGRLRHKNLVQLLGYSRRKGELLLEGAILETRDPRLGGDYLEEEMELVLKLGLLCSKYDAATRPSMRQLIQYLDGDVLLPEIIHVSTSIGTIGLVFSDQLASSNIVETISVKLDGLNYSHWSHLIRMMPAFENVLDEWDMDNSKIITWIANSGCVSVSIQLGQSVSYFYSEMPIIWDELTLMEPQQTVDAELYYEFREETRLVQFLMALKDDFEAVRASTLHRSPLLSVDAVLSEPLAETVVF